MQTLGTNPAAQGRAHPPISNRRRRIRHKVHIPAYAVLQDSAPAEGLNLNEILNISEEGVAVRTASRLLLASAMDICLDLSETDTKIKTRAQVIWSDDSGRAGMRFQDLDGRSLQQLKQWLFINSISAYLNHQYAVQSAQPVAPPALPKAELQPAEHLQHSPDHSTILAALGAIEREVQSLGPDLDAALQLVARRALTLTRATGAALALTEGEVMICRASAGPDAPSLGARLRIGSGFSGECVRTARPLRCDDSEIDELVDRQSCRVLGIRSMLAVPVHWNESVIGLLEVFSPQPFGFNRTDVEVLERLGESACEAVHRAGTPQPEVSSSKTLPDEEFPADPVGETETLEPISGSRRILYAAVIATLLIAGIWIIMPWNHSNVQPVSAVRTSPRPPAQSATSAGASLESLRQMAEQGDSGAQFALGARYATGEDVSQDYAEAVQWFAKAAEQGHVGAQAILGAYYWAGRGVPQDLVKAYFWSVLAQTGGDEASKYRVEVLASRMTRGQIIAAQQQADDWIREHQVASKAAQ